MWRFSLFVQLKCIFILSKFTCLLSESSIIQWGRRTSCTGWRAAGETLTKGSDWLEFEFFTCREGGARSGPQQGVVQPRNHRETIWTCPVIWQRLIGSRTRWGAVRSRSVNGQTWTWTQRVRSWWVSADGRVMSNIFRRGEEKTWLWDQSSGDDTKRGRGQYLQVSPECFCLQMELLLHLNWSLKGNRAVK